MLNENIAGGGNIAGTSGGTLVSNSAGVTINKTPIPSSGLVKTTVTPNSSSKMNITPNSGLTKSTVIPSSSQSVIDPAFLADHVKPGSGDLWLTNEDYAKLSPGEQQAYNTGGYSALQAYWKSEGTAAANQTAADTAQFDATYQTPGAGDQYITKSDYNNLSKAEQQAYTTGGYAALQQYWDQQKTVYNNSPAVQAAQAQVTALLKEAAEAQEILEKGTLNGIPESELSDTPVDTTALQQEMDTCNAQAALLQSYIDAQQSIPANVAALTSSTLTPYITVNKNGSFSVNAVQAASIGVDPATLKAAGVTDADIAQGQAQRSLAQYAVSGGGFDLNRAVADGVSPATLMTAYNFTSDDIVNAKAVNATMATLAKGYQANGGYQVAQAIADGAITQDQASAAGFQVSKSDIATAQQYNATMMILNKGYKSGDGYLVAQAVADGKITLKQAQDAGFNVTAADVSNAENNSGSNYVNTHPGDYSTGDNTDTNSQSVIAVKPNAKKPPAGYDGFYTIQPDGKGNYVGYYAVNDQVYSMSFPSLVAAQKYQSQAISKSLSPLGKVLAVLNGQGQQGELELIQAARAAHTDPLTKLYSEVTGNPVDYSQKVSPLTNIMDVVNNPEAQFISMGAMSAFDDAVAAGDDLATTVAKALSSIPKPIQYAVSAGMSGLSGYSTVKNWGSMTPVQRVQSIGFTIFPVVASGVTALADMPKNSELSITLDKANQAAETANQAAIKLTETPADDPNYQKVRADASDAQADAATAQNKLMQSIKDNPTSKMAKYIQDQILTKSATEAGIAQKELSLAMKAQVADSDYWTGDGSVTHEPSTPQVTANPANSKIGSSLLKMVPDDMTGTDAIDYLLQTSRTLRFGNDDVAAALVEGMKTGRWTAESIASAAPEFIKATGVQFNAPVGTAGKFNSPVGYYPTNDLASADAQAAIAKARQADEDFIDKISNTDNLTTKQLKKVEKLSGYDGLADDVKAVNTAAKNLKAAWADVDAERLYVTKNGFVDAKLGTPEYLQNLERVQAAEKNLVDAMDKYNTLIQPRTTISPASGYSGIISQTETDIESETREVSRLEVKEKEALTDNGRSAAHDDWLAMQNKVDSDKLKLEMLNKARDAGIPAPTVQKIISLKPTTEEEQQLIDLINKYAASHPKVSPDSSGGLATAVKTATVKAPVVTETKEEIAAGEQVPDVEDEKKAAPKITDEDTAQSSASKISPLFTKTAQKYESKETKTEQPGAMTPEQKARQSDTGDEQQTTWAVSNTPVHVDAKVVKQQFVTPDGKTLSAFTPKAQTAIIDITAAAVQTISDLMNKSKGKPVTDVQIKNVTSTVVNNKINAITSSVIKNQLKPVAGTIATTATNIQIKTQTKTDTKIKTEIPIKTTTPPTNNISLPKSSNSNQPPLTQSQKLAAIAHNRGAIGWNQGALYGKRRWDIILYPYDEASDHLIIFSNRPPAGAHIVTGAKSAFATAKVLYGKAPSKDLLINDVGFEHLTISPTGQGGGISLHYTPITKRPTAISGHKDLPNTNKQSIDGKGQVFPLR